MAMKSAAGMPTSRLGIEISKRSVRSSDAVSWSELQLASIGENRFSGGIRIFLDRGRRGLEWQRRLEIGDRGAMPADTVGVEPAGYFAPPLRLHGQITLRGSGDSRRDTRAPGRAQRGASQKQQISDGSPFTAPQCWQVFITVPFCAADVSPNGNRESKTF